MPVDSARLQIRDATPEDAEGIVAILNPIIETGLYTVIDGPISAAVERDFIRGCSPRGVFHVAIDPGNGALVGFQIGQPIAAYTHAFDHVCDMGTYVDLSRRRQGIASHLFRASFAALAAKGCEKLFTFVRADNPVSLQTYQHHGFTVIGTASRHARVRGRYIDEIIIEKSL